MPFFCPTPPTPPMSEFWPTLPILKFYGTMSPTPTFQPTPPTAPTPKFYGPTLPTPSTPNFEQCHPRTLASTLPTPPTNTRYPHHPRYLADSFLYISMFRRFFPWFLWVIGAFFWRASIFIKLCYSFFNRKQIFCFILHSQKDIRT